MSTPLSWDEAQDILAAHSQTAPSETLALAPYATPLSASPVLALTGGGLVASATASIAAGSTALVVLTVVLAGACYMAYRAYKAEKATSMQVSPELVELSVLDNPAHDVVPTSSQNLEQIAVLARENISTTQNVLASQGGMRRSESMHSVLSVQHVMAIANAFHNNPHIRSRFDDQFDEDCQSIVQAYLPAELHVPDHESGIETDTESEKGEVDPAVVRKLNELFNPKEAAI